MKEGNPVDLIGDYFGLEGEAKREATCNLLGFFKLLLKWQSEAKAKQREALAKQSQARIMGEIGYVTGDATAPIGDGPKIIVHVCNDRGGWGKGFVLAISKRWQEPEASYRQWFKDGTDIEFELGQVQFVKVAADLWVANLIGQEGMRAKGGKPPVRYEAIRTGLQSVAKFAKAENASVHMPRIGCGLAGGKWEEIAPILEQTLIAEGIHVTVYEFPG